MSRTRTRTSDYLSVVGPNKLHYPGQFQSEFFQESSYPGSNSCSHYKIRGASGISTKVGHPSHPCVRSNVPLYVEKALSHPTVVNTLNGSRLHLDWDELPSSSEFGLIQFVAELDELLATFSTSLLRQISYGSFTWNFLPLFNDTVAVLSTISSLAQVLGDTVPYEDSKDFSCLVPPSNGDQRIELLGKRRLTGKISLPDGSSILAALDAIGFHPDIATLWDIIPFSFVVDYILPIGDFLDWLSQRGWVNTVVFDGWETCRFVLTSTDYAIGQPNWIDYGVFSSYVAFSRHRVIMPLSTEPVPMKASFLPSFRQLFNILYLDRQIVGGRDRRGAPPAPPRLRRR